MAKGKTEKTAAPVGIDQVHEVISERQAHQDEKAKAAADEKAKAAAAAPKPAPVPNPSCEVDAPRLSAVGHQKELQTFRKNLAQRQLAELSKKFPVVAALVKENAQLKKLKS